MVEAFSALTVPLRVALASVMLVAALVVAVGARWSGEVEHRAVGGAGAVDRLDLEVVLGVGRQAAQRRRLGGGRVPVAVDAAGPHRGGAEQFDSVLEVL